jgi:hypothetical protein
MYIQIQNSLPVPITLKEVREANSDTSFREDMPASQLASLGVFKVEIDETPVINREVEAKVLGLPELVDGVWRQRWTVRTLNAEELQARLDRERAGMECTPLQGILTLGEANWGNVLDFRDGKNEWAVAADGIGGPATWETTQIINASNKWKRLSSDIVLIGFLLAFSDEQMDAMFRIAALKE